MTDSISGIGNHSVNPLLSAAAGKPHESVSVKGSHIQVKAEPEQTILEQYREQGVDLELTEGSGKFTEEELEQMKKEKEEDRVREMYQESLEASKESAKAAGEAMDGMARALVIARRMMNGDIVPGSDEKYLMDFDRDMYMGAKTMQGLARNEDPEKYDSVLEEEEGDGESSSVHVEGDHITVDASALTITPNTSADGPTGGNSLF